jgi:hypothetical protein
MYVCMCSCGLGSIREGCLRDHYTTLGVLGTSKMKGNVLGGCLVACRPGGGGMDAHLRIKFVPAGQLADKLSEGVHVQVLYMYMYGWN